MRSVINELESLKPEFDRQVDELNREDDELHRVGSDFPVVSYSSDSVEWPPVHRDPCSRPDVKKVQDFKIDSIFLIQSMLLKLQIHAVSYQYYLLLSFSLNADNISTILDV